MYKKWFLITCILVISSLAGCSSASEDHEKEQEETASHSSNETGHAHGDLRVETASTDELPDFLNEKPENMQVLYKAVAQSQTLLEQMPCYCGCGESVGHRNNYDCFIHENKESGAVVWDNHATKCGVCLEIAAQAIVDYQEGKSIKQIRAEIDAAYKEGYAEPTPTPEV